jgi:hypothetical protein
MKYRCVSRSINAHKSESTASLGGNDPRIALRFDCLIAMPSQATADTRRLATAGLRVFWIFGVPRGVRTPVTAVKGRCPGPLDDGDAEMFLSFDVTVLIGLWWS